MIGLLNFLRDSSRPFLDTANASKPSMSFSASGEIEKLVLFLTAKVKPLAKFLQLSRLRRFVFISWSTPSSLKTPSKVLLTTTVEFKRLLHESKTSCCQIFDQSGFAISLRESKSRPAISLKSSPAFSAFFNKLSSPCSSLMGA